MKTARPRRQQRGILMTYDIAMAAARDAGNRNMRKNGRAAWNRDDWNAMCDAFDKLIALA